MTSDDEGFLARWSRRKRGAASNARGRPLPEKTETVIASEASAASPPAGIQPLLDLESLPPIDSIGPGADIRAFLAPGVPADLARAALRRAWSTDPAIRDFIGLSENSWDFNAPGGVPGFGSMSTEEVRRLLAQATGEPNASEAASPTPEPLSEDQVLARPHESTPAPVGSTEDRPDHEGDSDANNGGRAQRSGEMDIAAQQELEDQDGAPPLRQRRHGSALPE